MTAPRAAVMTAPATNVRRATGRRAPSVIARPALAPVRWFNDVYCKRVMPRTATIISGDRSGAYKYLPASVETFLSRGQMEQMLRGAGFNEVRSTALTLGICVCYSGRVG